MAQILRTLSQLQVRKIRPRGKNQTENPSIIQNKRNRKKNTQNAKHFTHNTNTHSLTHSHHSSDVTSK